MSRCRTTSESTMAGDETGKAMKERHGLLMTGGSGRWLGLAGGNRGAWRGHAEHLLATAAFDQLAAHVVGDRQKLAATKIGANQLNSHAIPSSS